MGPTGRRERNPQAHSVLLPTTWVHSTNECLLCARISLRGLRFTREPNKQNSPCRASNPGHYNQAGWGPVTPAPLQGAEVLFTYSPSRAVTPVSPAGRGDTRRRLWAKAESNSKRKGQPIQLSDVRGTGTKGQVQYQGLEDPEGPTLKGNSQSHFSREQERLPPLRDAASTASHPTTAGATLLAGPRSESPAHSL